METNTEQSKPDLVTTYTDGSSNSECDRGGSGIFLVFPDQTSLKHRVAAGKIASNFNSELIAIKAALALYQSEYMLSGAI